MAEYKETVIDYVAGDIYMGISTGIKKYVNKILAFENKYPEYVKVIKNLDGSVCAKFSTEKFSMPFFKVKREMSAEQIESARERMKGMWEKEDN